jgi:hypothetical protein
MTGLNRTNDGNNYDCCNKELGIKITVLRDVMPHSLVDGGY